MDFQLKIIFGCIAITAVIFVVGLLVKAHFELSTYNHDETEVHENYDENKFHTEGFFDI